MGDVGNVVAAADLYEAQGKAMSLMLPLNPVNNEKTAGSALQCPNIQQGFQKSPWRAHSCKEGWPHLGIRLARHTHHHVSEDWEVPYQLCCSLQQRACIIRQAGGEVEDPRCSGDILCSFWVLRNHQHKLNI